MRKSKFLLLPAVLIGGAIGAAIALMTAPKSGKDLREDIKVKSDDIVSSGKEYLGKLKTKADKIFEKKERDLEQLLTSHKNNNGNDGNKKAGIPIETKISNSEN